jgi:hypothetical protein
MKRIPSTLTGSNGSAPSGPEPNFPGFLSVGFANDVVPLRGTRGRIFRQGLVHDVRQPDGRSKHEGAQRSKWLSAVPLSTCHQSTEIFCVFPYSLLTCTNRKLLRPANARSHGASLPWPPAYVRKNCGGLRAYPSLLIRAHGWPHGCSDTEPVPGRPWVQGLGQRWLPTG